MKYNAVHLGMQTHFTIWYIIYQKENNINLIYPGFGFKCRWFEFFKSRIRSAEDTVDLHSIKFWTNS